MSSGSNFEAIRSREAIEATAAVWLSLRDRGMTAAETAEFMRWLQLDPQHATVFGELDRTWKEFDQLGSLLGASSNDKPEADRLTPRTRAKRRRSQFWWYTGVAAAVAIMLFTAMRFMRPQHSAETGIGAFQRLDLPDGSIALLNTDTAIDIVFNAKERRVSVERGEVFFTVVKDTARPFVVTVGKVAVRAVGTAFNVRQRSDAVEVLVAEGRVRVMDAATRRSLLAPSAQTTVEPPLLAAGERAVVAVPASNSDDARTELAEITKLTPVALQRSLAWQERRLEFDEVPLGEIAREFNRYSRIQLVIEDAQLAQQRFSGVFRADGQESLVRLLKDDFGVRVTYSERETILRPSYSR